MIIGYVAMFPQYATASIWNVSPCAFSPLTLNNAVQVSGRLTVGDEGRRGNHVDLLADGRRATAEQLSTGGARGSDDEGFTLPHGGGHGLGSDLHAVVIDPGVPGRAGRARGAGGAGSPRLTRIPRGPRGTRRSGRAHGSGGTSRPGVTTISNASRGSGVAGWPGRALRPGVAGGPLRSTRSLRSCRPCVAGQAALTPLTSGSAPAPAKVNRRVQRAASVWTEDVKLPRIARRDATTNRARASGLRIDSRTRARRDRDRRGHGQTAPHRSFQVGASTL